MLLPVITCVYAYNYYTCVTSMLLASASPLNLNAPHNKQWSLMLFVTVVKCFGTINAFCQFIWQVFTSITTPVDC